MPERNFPPAWSVDKLDSCFVVKDANRQALAYMYFEKEPRRRFRRELLAAATTAQQHALLLTAALTGLRASELRGLRWSDVDLE
jgi:integrase